MLELDPLYSHNKQLTHIEEDGLSSMKFKTPKLVREFLAEVLGTFLLVVFGDGAIMQVVLGNGGTAGGQSSQFFGGFLNICLGYGLALMIGILVSGGVSGGHLNPAVTLAMAAIKKLKPIQIPIYMAGQYLGAFLGAAVLYGIYADAIHMVDPDKLSTHTMFASYPNTFKISPNSSEFAAPSVATLAMDQMFATALLVVIILAVTDDKNMKVIGSMVPLLIGLGLCAIHISFGLNAGCAINPARDLSPRIFTFMAGYGDKTFKAEEYFFWIPWLLPHLGGVIGALVYQFMVALHHGDE
jgi:MIP family channel proteins